MVGVVPLIAAKTDDLFDLQVDHFLVDEGRVEELEENAVELGTVERAVESEGQSTRPAIEVAEGGLY